MVVEGEGKCQLSPKKGMCQEFLGLVFTPILQALYFCTAISATALTLAGLE